MNKPKSNQEFEKFKELTKNLINVSNSEVRAKMEEEKRKKKPQSKRKAR
jgi:hypothetical protein